MHTAAIRQGILLGLGLAGALFLAACSANGPLNANTAPNPARHLKSITPASSSGRANAPTTLTASATAGSPAGGVLGDVTGDGLADILAIDPAGKLWLYSNTGSDGPGMFNPRTQVGSGWAGYILAGLAPLYGASRPGLLAIDQAGNMWYYPNTGGTGVNMFGARSQVGQGWTDWTVVGVADLYGTGAPGILAFREPGNDGNAGDMFYYPNIGGTGLNTFGYGPNVGVGWTGYTADLADINGDGKPDILAVDPAGKMWLYANAGGTNFSTFGAPTQVGSGWSGYQAVDVGQLTSTGAASILAIDPAGDLWFYPNSGGSGTSTFGTRAQLGIGWTGYRIN